MSQQSILEALRAGPLNLADWNEHSTCNKSFHVQIHKLRERGYGIRVTKMYELMYEPDMAPHIPRTTIPGPV